MEILLKTVTVFLILLLFASPILIAFAIQKWNFSKNFILLIGVGLVVTFMLVALIGWWAYFSNGILMSYYGYDFEAMNAIDRFKNVTSDNLEAIKVLEANLLGVGWPLKVILSYLFIVPIITLEYVAVYFLKIKR